MAQERDDHGRFAGGGSKPEPRGAVKNVKELEVKRIVSEMKRKGQLEDRAEYTKEDLKSMYGVSDDQASALYDAVQSHFK